MADTNKIYIGGPNTQPKNIYIQNDKVKQIYKGNDLLYSMSEEYTNRIKFNIYKKRDYSNEYQTVNDIYFSYSTWYTNTTPDNELYSNYAQQDVSIDNLLGQDKMNGKTSYYYYIHPYNPHDYKNTSYSYIQCLDLSNLDINRFFAYSKALSINDLSNGKKSTLIFNGCDFSNIGNIYIHSYSSSGSISSSNPFNIYLKGAKFRDSNKLKDLLSNYNHQDDEISDYVPSGSYLTHLDFRNVRFVTEPKTLNSYELFLGHNQAYNIDFSADIIKWNTSMKRMFGGCQNLTSLDVSKWDVSKVIDMSSMFSMCKNLTSLDVSKWDVSNVTNMSWMFYNCQNLTSLDVSKWDVSKVINMGYMFYIYAGYAKLKLLDVSNWNVSNVTNMRNMFNSQAALTSLDVSKWDVSKVIDMGYMFASYDYGSIKHNLTSLDVSKWDVSNVIDMSSMFFGMNSLTALDLSKWNVSNVTNMRNMFIGCSELKTLIAGHESETNVTVLNGLKVDIDLSDCTKLNNKSIMAVCRGLATLPTDNKKTITVPNKVKDDTLTKLNVELTAENKHWNVVYK